MPYSMQLTEHISNDPPCTPEEYPQSKQTRENHPVLFQCRASVEGVGTTLKQYWVNGMIHWQVASECWPAPVIVVE